MTSAKPSETVREMDHKEVNLAAKKVKSAKWLLIINVILAAIWVLYAVEDVLNNDVAVWSTYVRPLVYIILAAGSGLLYRYYRRQVKSLKMQASSEDVTMRSDSQQQAR